MSTPSITTNDDERWFSPFSLVTTTRQTGRLASFSRCHGRTAGRIGPAPAERASKEEAHNTLTTTNGRRYRNRPVTEVENTMEHDGSHERGRGAISGHVCANRPLATTVADSGSCTSTTYMHTQARAPHARHQQPLPSLCCFLES